jgi:hypothetical protein
LKPTELDCVLVRELYDVARSKADFKARRTTKILKESEQSLSLLGIRAYAAGPASRYVPG